ncbi:MAG: UPF0182 family protein [Chloroflexia bacterium]
MRRPLFVVLGIIAVAAILLFVTSGFWVNWLWFDSLGLRSLLMTRYVAQWSLFLGAFVVAGLFFGLNIRYAGRKLLGAPVEVQGQQVVLAPRLISLVSLVAGIVVGVLMASTAAGNWFTVLSYLNRTDFGVSEPIYGRDAGFYIFTMPLLEAARSWLLGLLILTLLAVAGLAFLRYTQGVARRQFTLPQDVRGHLSLLGALTLALFSFSYWLANFDLMFSGNGNVYGVGRTDYAAQRPANYILLGLSLLAALFLAWNAFARRLRPLLITVGVWLVAALVVGILFPAGYQQFFVRPNELGQERPYILNNIGLTRQAFGLDKITPGQLRGDAPVSAADVTANATAIGDIRLWDYRPLLTTYRQIQRFGQYYDFVDVDVDRYQLSATAAVHQQTMLSARELDVDLLDQRAQTWQNRHLVYTHGYGAVVSPVNRFNAQGQPDLLLRNIPPTGNDVLKLDRPQIYFGERTEDYAIVRTTVREFDRPGTAGTDEYSNYAAEGGVGIGSPLTRLLFATAYADSSIFLSGNIQGDSRILYHRTIKDRVTRVAPFLTLDSDPYLIILDGRLIWVQDAFTSTTRFPYSTPYAMANGQAASYIRNSVKVTVDAYTGEMRFYVVDEQDPLLRTYRAIYPDLFTPLSAAPAGLAAHFRYPEDLFEMQARVYTRYHMTDPQAFYNQGDLWAIAKETYDTQVQPMEPYYVTLTLPGQTKEEFALILPFTPAGQNRDNMVSWMAARSDGANYGQLQVYTFPSGTLIYGPQQIEARINQDVEISQQLTLLNQVGSSVIRGNLLVIPLGDAILYVQPLYLQARSNQGATSNALPELKRIIVTTSSPNQGVVMSDRLDTALAALAQGRTGVVASSPLPNTGTTSPTPSPSPGPSGTPTVPGNQADLAAQALDHYNRAQAALKAGDWATYGTELAEMERLLKQIAGR